MRKKRFAFTTSRIWKKIGKNEIAIIGKIGARKKMEIVKKAMEKKIQVHGTNLKRFARKMERMGKHKKSGGKK